MTKPELWGLMHSRVLRLQKRLETLRPLEPELVLAWEDPVSRLSRQLTTILMLQKNMGPRRWAQEVRRATTDGKVPEEEVMLVLASSLVRMETALSLIRN